MIPKLSLCLLSTLMLLIAGTALAQQAPTPAAPQIAAESYVLMDYDSGQIIASRNPELELDPASITKLMTSYVVFKQLEDNQISLTDEVRISERAWRTPGSRSFVEVNERVPVETLLKGMIVQSGNDASVALAEHVAGSEDAFAELMNFHAEQLGLQHSQFRNATGLPQEGHYVSALDMAKLSRALIREYPDYYAWYAIKRFSYNGIDQPNRNALLWRDESVDGLKTGHTESAGYCLVASAKREDMRLISVVMKTDSESARAAATQSLLNYGFRFFRTYKLYEAGQPITQTRVYYGEITEVPLGVRRDFHVTVPRGRYDDLNGYVSLEESLQAPLSTDRAVGTARVELDDTLLAQAPLYPLREVNEGGWWRSLTDWVSLWWQE